MVFRRPGRGSPSLSGRNCQNRCMNTSKATDSLQTSRLWCNKSVAMATRRLKRKHKVTAIPPSSMRIRQDQW